MFYLCAHINTIKKQKMTKVITMAGSTSRNSINKKLVEFAGSCVDSAEVVNLDLKDYEIPLYSIDHEQEFGFSDDLLRLDRMVSEADGIILSLAEHNGAYSAAFKNAFDWLSRIESKVWRNKPMLLLSTSPGARGGQSVLEMALKRFPFNGGNIVASMSFPSFNENFKEGEVVNVDLKNDLLERIAEFKKQI